MQFVDTHCHLNFDAFQENIHQVVDRALEAGVNRIVVPGLDLKTSERAVELSHKYDCIFAAVGIHPSEVERYTKEEYRQFEKLVVEQKVVAVGEIGLDFYHHPESQSVQMEILESMLNLASANDKPVILHSRKAIDVLFTQIHNWLSSLDKSVIQQTGVFHGFEGDASQAQFVHSLHMKLGIGGPITFKNGLDKQKLVKELGLSNLVLETDSPLLSPHPFRGQPNEPARIPIIAQKIADLLEISVEEVANVSSKNAQTLFRWDVSH